MSERWTYEVWCRYCLDDDPAGCFDGTREMTGEEYPDRVSAEKAAEEDYQRWDGAPWAYGLLQFMPGVGWVHRN